MPSQTIGSRACEVLVQVNHYYTRSFEEFEAKRFRGSATGRIARPAIPFDLPALRLDITAQRFAERTRATLAFMDSLARSPYHYGSQLGATQFPHFNDLGLFAEFAIANVVAEEPQPRREPTLRLENLHAGTGFVGRLPATIGDAGRPAAPVHRPRRGDLSASVHLAPLLERSRGRLEASWAADVDLPRSTVRAGALEDRDDGWLLTRDAAVPEVALEVDLREQRRCLAVGVVLTTEAATTLQLALRLTEADDLASAEVILPDAGMYAGIVELDPNPSLAERVLLRFDGAAESIVIHDLFVISYG